MVTHMPQFNSIPPSGIHPGTRAHHLVARQVGGTTYYYYYNYYYALLRKLRHLEHEVGCSSVKWSGQYAAF